MLCPICRGNRLKKINIQTREADQSLAMKLFQCKNCEVLFADDFQKERIDIYDKNYGAWSSTDVQEVKQIEQAKTAAFKAQLKNLLAFIEPSEKKLLDIGVGGGYLLTVADNLGFDCYGTEISEYWARVVAKKFPQRIFTGPLAENKFENNFFDVVCLTDVLEHLNNPQETLKEIGRILKPAGYLLVISPNSDSSTRKIFGKNWFQYKYEHVFYFNKKSVSHVFRQAGLKLLKFKNNKKKFPLSYYHHYFRKYSFLGFGKFLGKIYPFLPETLKNFCFSNPVTGEFLAIAQKNEEIKND